jgi:hypothetical protein
MARTVGTAPEGGVDGDGLCGSVKNASAGGGLGDIIALGKIDSPVIQQNRRLRMLESALDSSERPTVVVGQRLSRRSRLRGLHGDSPPN